MSKTFGTGQGIEAFLAVPLEGAAGNIPSKVFCPFYLFRESPQVLPVL